MIVFTLILLLPAAYAVSCIGSTGSSVDWWFAYKLNGGVQYVYIDSLTTLPKRTPLTLSGGQLDSATGPLGRTLTQLITGRSTLARVSWNDELPVALGASGSDSSAANATSGTSGHTKGVLGGNAAGGFYLTHTLPKFPDLSQGTFTWGGASTTYGQNFLCLSLDRANLELASLGMQYNDPHVYDSAIPNGMLSTLPATAALVAGQRKAGSRVQQLATLAGSAFLQVSKSGSTGLDLYEDVLQAALQQDMWVETWRRSPMMDSYCRPAYAYNSLNVQGLTFLDEDGTPFALKYTQCV